MSDFVSRRQQRQKQAPRMQNLQPRKRKVLNKKAVVIAVVVLIVAMIAWFNVQNNQFVNKLKTSKQTLKSAIETVPAKIKAAEETNDTNATVTALREVSATVSQNAKSLPTTPTILGLSFGVDAERKNRDQLSVAAESYAQDTQELADYIAFQSVAARQLQSLSLKDVSGYNQTIELANAWRDTKQKLENEPKPQRLNEVIATLLQKMEIVESTIRDMAELYKNTDETGFKAKKAQLTATIDEFKEVGTQIGAIGAKLDAELADSATKLNQNL